MTKRKKTSSSAGFVFHGFIVREFAREVKADSLDEARSMYDDSPRQVVSETYKPPIEVLFDIVDPAGDVVYSKEPS